MVNRKKYPKSVILNLTAMQYQQLKEKSKKNGVSASDFLRMQIEYAPKNIVSMQELLKKLIYEVNKVGVNINQIAHAANIGIISEKEKKEFFAYTEKLNRDLKKAVDLFGNK